MNCEQQIYEKQRIITSLEQRLQSYHSSRKNSKRETRSVSLPRITSANKTSAAHRRSTVTAVNQMNQGNLSQIIQMPDGTTVTKQSSKNFRKRKSSANHSSNSKTSSLILAEERQIANCHDNVVNRISHGPTDASAIAGAVDDYMCAADETLMLMNNTLQTNASIFDEDAS